MISTSLTKLTISHLRGAVGSFELSFEKGKKLTIIYGENGTGKSTICDALEFLGKGKIGSLDNRGLGSKTTRYWSSVNKEPSDISVVLDAAGVECRAVMDKNNVIADPPDARPRVEVLRRSQILALLEAAPADRYAAISRFIDVSPIETAENALRALIKDLNVVSNDAATRISENLETIDQFWQTAGSPGAHALGWAETETQRNSSANDPELDALRTLQTAYGQLTSYPARIAKAEDAVLLAEEAAAAAEQQVQSSMSTAATDAAELVALLQAARSYLGVHQNPEVCPVCERPEGSQDLDERLNQRLQAFAMVQQAQSVQSGAADRLQRAIQQRDIILEQLAQDVANFGQACTQFAWSPDIALPDTQPPASATDLAVWLAATEALPDRWNAAESTRQDHRQFLTTLKSALNTYNENLQSQAELNTLLPNLQRALEIVEEERKAFIDAILSQIADEVGRLYEAVHPGEGLNKIRLELDAAKRASLDIATSFAGQSGPPQAYFSQSHLDTLGLCVFLALANLDTPANTILVLDDVLASVDEPHVDRLISMLYDESLKFRHCIITTHYGPWRHKLRWGWLKNNQCQFVELSRWSTTSGISVIRSVPEVERLQALLADPAPDLQAISSKAGVILEAALDFLTQLYECSVPRKPEPRYTLGELLPSVKSKLRKNLRVEVQEIGTDKLPVYKVVYLEPVLNELERIMQTRNVMGAHFNAISFDLHDADALLFGQKVLELIEALVDPVAGWPRNGKSGSYWANASETRRLHPLKQPA